MRRARLGRGGYFNTKEIIMADPNYRDPKVTTPTKSKSSKTLWIVLAVLLGLLLLGFLLGLFDGLLGNDETVIVPAETTTETVIVPTE